jgi:2-amino-4-hydroxy-6-hydroxymethyldihydropteridine diphosphokinase
VTVRAYIAIGSNLGDRARHCDAAEAALAHLPESRLLRCSPRLETAPAEGVAGGAFLNGAAELETALAPRALLAALQAIEAALGRPPRHLRGLARPIDLDLLLYGDLRLEEPDLILPHPRMAERRFVLEPLAALAPTLRHPALGLTIAALLARLPAEAPGAGVEVRP